MHGTQEELLYALISACELGDAEVVRSILGSTAEPGALPLAAALGRDNRAMSSTFGLTALHCCKFPETAAMLVDAGFPVGIRGHLGQTPLHTCCESTEVVRVLLSRGADPNAQTDDGSTPAEWAVVADATDTVKLLVEHGADVNLQNNNGNTCLHLVCSTAMVALLLSIGARVSTENHKGQIPLETAAERKGEPEAEKIAEMLLDISHDRGLKNRCDPRSRRRLDSSSSSLPAADSWAADAPLAPIPQPHSVQDNPAKHRWSLVRKAFLGKKQAAESSPRFSAAPTNVEWFNDAGTNGAATMDSTSVRSIHSMDLLEENSPVENFYASFFKMAAVDRPFLAKKMLDKQRKFMYAKGTSKIYTYDFSLLGTLAVTTGLRTIVENDRADLVVHDVVQFLVNAKWAVITKHALKKELALHLVFLAAFCFSSLRMSTGWATLDVLLLYACELVLVLLSLRMVLRWFKEFVARGATAEVAQSIVRADKLTGWLYFFVPMQQSLRLLGCEEHEMSCTFLTSVSAILCWTRVLYFGEPLFQSVGVTMAIVRRMIVDISEYIICALILLCGFAHSMSIIFRGEKHSQFPGFGSSMVTLFFFIFNVDPTATLSSKFSNEVLGTFILICFQLLIVVLFVNLLIAVMTNTFENVMQFSKEEWLLQRAKFVVRTEDQLNFGMLMGGARPLDASFGFSHQRIVVVVERADGFTEVRVPETWLEDENEYLKTTAMRYLPTSYGTMDTKPAPPSRASKASNAAAAADERSFRTHQSSETIKELRPGASDVLVATFQRSVRRDDVASMLQDPDVIRALEKVLRGGSWS